MHAVELNSARFHFYPEPLTGGEMLHSLARLCREVVCDLRGRAGPVRFVRRFHRLSKKRWRTRKIAVTIRFPGIDLRIWTWAGKYEVKPDEELGPGWLDAVQGHGPQLTRALREGGGVGEFWTWTWGKAYPCFNEELCAIADFIDALEARLHANLEKAIELCHGRVFARVDRPVNDLTWIHPGQWRYFRVVDECAGTAVGPETVLYDIWLHYSCREKQGRSRRSDTPPEAACERWLLNIMNSSQPSQGNGKKNLRTRALKQWPGLAERAFDRAWASAGKRANSKSWFRRGRRPKIPHQKSRTKINCGGY